MNKTELISAVAKESNIKKNDVDKIIGVFLDTVINEVAKGEKVQITGFGTFERKVRGERVVRNLHTGEQMKVPPSKSPSFASGSVFKEKVK